MTRPGLLVVLAILLSACAMAQEPVDRVIAVVNENIILESEVLQYAQSLALQNREDPMKYIENDELKAQILDQLVDQQVLLAIAEGDTNIKLEEREVKRELEARIDMMLKEVGSEAELEKIYGMSIREIRRELEKIIHDGLLVEKLRQRKIANVKVSRDEIQEFYQQNREKLTTRPETVELAHILFKIEPEPEAEVHAKGLADSLYNALLAGADFKFLAEKYSQDPGTVKRGGALGFTKRGDLVPAYEETAFALNPGEISQPVRSKFGYHIIRLNERQGEKINTSHILIKLEPTSSDKARVLNLAKTVYDSLQAGADFAVIAKRFSQDSESAETGGDLGAFSIKELVPLFADKIRNLSEGDYTTPFESAMGVQILKLTKRMESRPITLENDWNQVSNIALNWKQEKVYSEWLNDLKEEVYIEIKK
jgi:peptidyl-prolyl cis-trans isomerase SurA